MVTGEAKYLDDLKLPGMAHVAILRSPYAHARIKGIDTTRAAAAPGVVAVYTGKDFEDLPALPCAWQAGGVENLVNTPRALEIDRVMHTGAGVAAVVAESRDAAEDARELIEVDWEPLDVVVDVEEAVAEGALQLHENAPGNIVMDWTCGDAEGTEQALAEAEVVVKQRLVNQRLIGNPMEPRGAAAQYEPATGQYTVWMTSQTPHIMRLLMTAFVFGIPETKMRCIALHVGGGFGTKIDLYHEYVLMAALAAKVGRPVKWMETRGENYVATTQGRDHVTYVELGAKRDGTITALKAKTYANLGGILSTIAPGIPTTLYGRMLSGAYRIPNIHCQVLGVYTNTGMVDAYRGAGRPEATYALERTVDLLARELELDPVELRRKNFIPPDAFPYDPGVLNGLKYDTGDYDKALTRALEIVDYEGFRREQDEARSEERLRGIGFSTYVEMCGVAPSAWIGTVGEGWGASMWESANVRVHLTGKVVVTTGTQPHGQGHETTMSQIVADELGVPIEDVTVEWGDTQGTPFGYGVYGSRAVAVGHVALYESLQKIKAKARRLAAHMLETDVEDIDYEAGSAFVKGAREKAKTIQEIAGAAALGYDLPAGEEPFLDDTTYYDPSNCTFPFGTHIAIVEVDRETGEVDARALRRGRRRRQGDQPDDRRRPAPRRDRPGGGAGALGERRLRRERPAHDREPHGLRDSEGRVPAHARGGADRDAHGRQPAGREGRGRDRHDRLDAGGRERGHGRARPARDQAPGHAAHAGARVAGDAGSEGIAMYTMRPAEFEYHRPTSLDEAVSLLRENEEARPIAGGHSLLPMMKLRLATPAALVDVGRIPGLDTISTNGGGLTIGALARHAAVASSEVVRAECPVLAETAALIGDPQVRNRGTLGGSIAHADPASDYPTVLKALGATITAVGADGEREIGADDFFLGIFSTACSPGELLTSVKVPGTPAGTGACYLKHRHPASSYCVVGVAAVVTVEGGACTRARLTVGGLTAPPVHATAAADALTGGPGSEEAIAAAAEKVEESIPEAIGDAYASSEYRTHLAKVLAARALARAFERAG